MLPIHDSPSFEHCTCLNGLCFYNLLHYDDEQESIRTEDGLLEPVWSCGPVLPNSLIDLLNTGDSEEVDEEEFDFDDDFSESVSYRQVTGNIG